MGYFQKTKNRIGLTLQEYSLIKKYSCGEASVLEMYRALTEDKVSCHLQLIRDNVKQLLQKENIGNMIFGAKIPHKDVELSDLKPTRTGTNQKDFNNVMKFLNNMIGKPIIVNFYSEIGEQSNMAGSYVVEHLLESHKGLTTNGIDLNQKSVEFDDNVIENMLKKEFLAIFSINSVFITDFRKQFMSNLYTSAKLKNVPLITTSNQELKVPDCRVINIRLTDKKKNQEQLIAEIFGTEGDK